MRPWPAARSRRRRRSGLCETVLNRRARRKRRIFGWPGLRAGLGMDGGRFPQGVLFPAACGVEGSGLPVSCRNGLDDFPLHVCQALVASVVAEGHEFVIHAEQVQNGGMEILRWDSATVPNPPPARRRNRRRLAGRGKWEAPGVIFFLSPGNNASGRRLSTCKMNPRPRRRGGRRHPARVPAAA